MEKFPSANELTVASALRLLSTSSSSSSTSSPLKNGEEQLIRGGGDGGDRRGSRKIGGTGEGASGISSFSVLKVVRQRTISSTTRALSLDSSIRHCHSLICSNKVLHPKFARKLEEDLQRARCLMVDGDASGFLSSKAQGRFLRMFLGLINVRATRKDVQLKVKEEYNSYRERIALLFLLFPSVLLILRASVWGGCVPAFPVQLYQDLNLDYAKVVQALNLDYAHFHPRHTNGFASEYDAVLNARTEGLLAQQRRGLRAEAVLRLPQEWTY